jgi:hypothetical protein
VTTTPWRRPNKRSATRAARRAPRHEIRRYQAGHFEIYVGEAFEQVVADQIVFLNEHCPPREMPGA